MAVTVKIKGDTKDAQQKVRQLTKDVEKLDKEAKKAKKINIQGKVIGGGVSGASGASVGGRLSQMGRAGATAIGTMSGNLVTELIKGVVTYLPAALRLGAGAFGEAAQEGVVKAGATLRKLFAGIEVYGNPGQEALARGDKLDALDDERRSHNSASNAEEFAYSRAFSNVAGVNGTQIVDRVQAYLDMATSGVASEMDKAWKHLSGFGITYEDIQKGSTWQVLSKMLAAYHNAGADGENELEHSMQQIIGKRQMAAIRKIGDGSEMNVQAAQIMEEFTKLIANEAEILKAAAQSELTRTIGEIHGMAIPDSGVSYIGIGAQEISDTQQFKGTMLGDGAGKALSAVWSESGISSGISAITGGFKDFVKMINPFADFGDDTSEESSGVINTAKDIFQGAGDFVRSAPRTLERIEMPTPEFKGLFQWDKEDIGAGRTKYKAFDPAGQTKKAWDYLFSSNTNASSGETRDNSAELNSSVKELTREIKLNTTATSAMANNIQVGNSTAHFA